MALALEWNPLSAKGFRIFQETNQPSSKKGIYTASAMEAKFQSAKVERNRSNIP